jgi:phage tail-like protein
VPGDAQSTGWPTPKFSFVIEIAGVATNVRFQEVTGLEAETQPIEFRRGGSPNFSTIKMPGLRKAGNVTLKRGIFVKDNKFVDWVRSIQANTAQRSTVTIKLIDESGQPTMTWTLTNAWPTKFASADLKASGNEVAVESIELAHEGLTIDNK